MVSEPRNQPMAWMETDYSKQTHFRWKIKWRLKHLGALGIMGETPFNSFVIQSHLILPLSLPSFLPSLPFLLHSGCELQTSSSATSAQLLFGRWPRLGVCRQLNSLDEHKTTRYWAKDPNNPSDRTTRMNGEIEESSSFSWDQEPITRSVHLPY